MSTIYPAQIDSSLSLPVAQDRISAFNAALFNNLRDAIIVVEGELGVKPSGVYTTVRTRLDVLESILQGLEIGGSVFVAGHDLAGISGFQTVIGLQGRSLLSITPTTNQAILFNGTAWSPTTIETDFITQSFSVSFFGTSIVEVGEVLHDPLFHATYLSGSPISAILTDNDSVIVTDVSSTPTLFSSADSFLKTTFGNSVVFTLVASNGPKSASTTFTTTWGQNNYFGIAAPGGSGAGFITSLSSVLDITRATIFSVTAGSNQKIYYSCRSGYGTPTFRIDGFEGGMTLTSAATAVTNTWGVIENYQLWESDNVNLGLTTVEVI